MEVDIRYCLKKAQEQADSEALQSAYSLLTRTAAPGSSRRTPPISPELYVLCAESALQLGCLEISSACLKMFFEGNPPTNQFLCQAYLCQGQLQSPPATGTAEDYDEAVQSFLKAIDLAKSDPGCSFIVFNASVLYSHSVRLLLQPGRCHHLVPSLRQVIQGLGEVNDQDHSWRAELMIELIRCLVDAGNKEEASCFSKITEEFIESKTPHLYARLFTLQVRHRLQGSDVLIERISQSPSLSVIYQMEGLKKLEEMNGDKPTGEELEKIFHFLENTKISVDSGSPPIQPADRVAFLLELALLALQLKHQKVAADCLKEIKSAGEASIGQHIIMECVKCEINVLKRGEKMNDCSRASVKARLKEIGKLDQCLQAAVRDGEPRAMQAVCVTQWSLCMPLLQHNLRKHIKAPLLRVSQALEDMQSMMLETRCQVHSELAVIEEEDGHLQAALTHLQKASLLDNGKQRERLSSAVRLLQLRATLHQTPPWTEDKAAMLMQQVKDLQPKDRREIRPVLVSVGLLLAPDDFQMVLDADNTPQIPVGSPGSGPASQLAAKAQHHSACVQKVDGHLDRQGQDTEDKERVKLWATLVKTARKQEIWDVCRAACRFCLLYDDGRWRISKTDNKMMRDPQTDESGCPEEERFADHLPGCDLNQAGVKELLHLLAKVHFFSAEATVQKLLLEGVKLNCPVVPVLSADEHLSEEDSHWVVYRDWIQALSAYATTSFLRAAELGAEIEESWVITNAAVYFWNYNSHVLAEGEYQRLLPALQSLVEMLRHTEYTGSHALLVLLCDALARGLIQPLCGPDSVEPALSEKKSKSRAGKEKTSSAQALYLDHANLQELHKAAELCDFALDISSRSSPEEAVPIAVRKRVISTWVQIKRLLQQQISINADNKEESENKEAAAMTRVLVGVEMLQCNKNPRHMEFSVPGPSTLVNMAVECSWTDAAVELQVWCQLASFCHDAGNHGLVLCCTERALQLEEAAEQSLRTLPCVLYGPTAVAEMLSSAACLRGMSLVHESRGKLDVYRDALKVFLSGISFAEKAEDPALCSAAARHYWNACLPLTQAPEERLKLQEPLEKILTALAQCYNKQKPAKVKAALTSTETDREVLTIRATIYSLLVQIQTDREDWRSALQLLDKALREIPDKGLQLPLLKQRILIKTRLGESVLMDMKTFKDREQCCLSMWHQVALCSDNITHQLNCYQKSISSLKSAETRWQKVDLLLEFAEWLFCHSFPKDDAGVLVQWAVDLLLQREGQRGAEVEPNKDNSYSEKPESSVRDQDLLPPQSLSDLKEVGRLDSLIRAHTLQAVMADRTTPEHQLNLLQAYSFVLQIWKVSMAVCCEISKDLAKSHSSQPPPSAGSKKDKDKSKGRKVKDPPPPAEEKPKPVVLSQEPPSTPDEWARFDCPEQAREIFRTNKNPHCINTYTLKKQLHSLFYLNLLDKELCLLSLDHLTLPIMHLAETIALDLLDKKSLSNLYRLRIVQMSCRLGAEGQSPYHQQLLSLSQIPEQELVDCYREITSSQERKILHKNHNQSVSRLYETCWSVWVDEAEVCISMGLFQPARHLLMEAKLVATELGDQRAAARSLLHLAALECEEQNFSQALVLLDKAEDLGGDEEFWYELVLTRVRAVVGQRDEDLHMKVDHIIKQGCEALTLVMEQRVNPVQQLRLFITSLKMRGAVECVRALGGGRGPGETLCEEAVQELKAACETLKGCAHAFIDLGYRKHTAEAHEETARGLRVLAAHAYSCADRRRLLLDCFSHLQSAVTEQESVLLNAQRMLPSHEESSGLSLSSARRLQRLRLDLAEFSLVLLEEHCAEKTLRALTQENKTSAEIALEEFTCCSPEPGSVEEEWLSICSTVGQVALVQLAAVRSQSSDSVEGRAHSLGLMGKYLRLQAMLEDPLYLCALWDRNKQTETWSDLRASSVEEGSEEERYRSSGRRETTMSSAKSVELQQKRRRAQQLLDQACKALSEASSLCLQHNLSSTLSEVSMNMLECYGRSDPAVTGQQLALFQSCCTVSAMADVLTSAWSCSSDSQLSALLNLHRKLLRSQEEQPSSMLRRVQDSLNSLCKTFSQIRISPDHLNLLTELPPNLKILLLQHSEDGSELYGALYELNETPKQKGKTAQAAGSLMCSEVAKVCVCPRALLDLREKTRAFGQESSRAFFKETCRQTWIAAEDVLQVSKEQQVSPGEPPAEETLTPHFREVVKDMEEYLKPLLDQFNFSSFRPRAASLSVPEMTKTRDKEKKESTAGGQYVVLLADRQLLELPLEALSILQEDRLTSVSRDFSLQLLHSRLSREEPQKVESDNKKETKGGKGAKAKTDQSPAIKGMSRVFPPHILPIDTRSFKYIVDPRGEGSFGGTSLSRSMEEILETHGHLTSQWEGFTGSKHMTCGSEMQQLLSRCSSFIFLGTERFMANIPAGKLAGLRLTECRMALIFDLVQTKDSTVRQTDLDAHKSPEQLELEKPLQSALLLSLGGVGCVALNQWHSSFQHNIHRAKHVLDNLLRSRLTSGQMVHALRTVDQSEASRNNVSGSPDQVLSSGSEDDDVPHWASLTPSAFSFVLYGLPNLMLT